MLVAIFQVANNAELEQLSGIRDKTYDKWKRWLRDNGWVLILGTKVGRGHGIEVVPAMGHSLVVLTDMSQQKVAQIKGGNISPRPAPNQPRPTETPPKTTPLSPRVHARIETPSGLLNPRKEFPLYPPTEDDVVRLDEKGGLQIFGRLREHWLREFGGDAKGLDLSLMSAARYVQGKSQVPLEARVSGQLARQLAEKRDKDARYAAAAVSNARIGPNKPKETDPYKIMDAIAGPRK